MHAKISSWLSRVESGYLDPQSVRKVTMIKEQLSKHYRALNSVKIARKGWNRTTGRVIQGYWPWNGKILDHWKKQTTNPSEIEHRQREQHHPINIDTRKRTGITARHHRSADGEQSEQHAGLQPVLERREWGTEKISREIHLFANHRAGGRCLYFDLFLFALIWSNILNHSSSNAVWFSIILINSISY